MQRDVVLRWLSQISVLVARLLRRDAGVSIEEVQQQLDEAREMLLGNLTRLLPHLDPARCADLLVDPHRIFGYAQLVALDSAMCGARGDPGSAAVLAARAIALAEAAIARIDPVPKDWTDWVAAARLDVEAAPDLTPPAGGPASA